MSPTAFTKGLEVTALLAGSFLSGSMMTVSIILIPVAIDTATQPSHLLHHWLRMFHYGHRIHPTLALLTSTLYGYAAWRRKAANKPWSAMAWAGLITLSISPFTWLFMLPTNRTITELATASRDAALIGIGDAKCLVIKWSWMHLVRSLFPLAGAAVGINLIFGS